MSATQGTNVAAPIVPGDTEDQFPTHLDTYGQGGYRAVADDVARDAIPAPRRSAGMLIWHAQDQLYYRLTDDLTTWTPAFGDAAYRSDLGGYDLPFSFEGSPGAGARLAAIILVRRVWMPFDLAGSMFRVDAAAGDYALAVQHVRDGEVLVAGTATLHPDGTATLALDGDVDGWPGDEIWIFAPATPDAGVASVRGTIKAEALPI